MIKKCQQIVAARWFNATVIFAILLAGIVVGLETCGRQISEWLPVLYALDWFILAIFTIEAVIKIIATIKRPQKYFLDPWNLFDFMIVVVCWLAIFIPDMDAGFVTVFRLARILRVFRLVHALPQLKLLADAMLKSIPSMGYVGVLLLLLFYIYGVMGVFMFGENDPLHFADLPSAMITLFQVTTLEGWVDVMYVNVYGCDDPVYGYPDGCVRSNAMGGWALAYFVSFVLIGTMIVLNLFIGVIMNSMDEVRNEQLLEERLEAKAGEMPDIEVELLAVQQHIDQVKEQLEYIAFRLRDRE